MKKYKSPVFEITPIDMADIITGSIYQEIGISDNGDLDNGGSGDVITW